MVEVTLVLAMTVNGGDIGGGDGGDCDKDGISGGGDRN